MRLAVPVLPSIVLCVCALWLSLGAADGADAAEAIAPDAVKGVLPALDGMAQDAIRTGEVPGLAVAVVAGDEVVFLKGYGVREAGKPGAVGPDTVFQLASCSKPIASSVAAALVGQGHLTWDTRIAAIDPAFQLHDAYPTAEVTVRDLFAHRSGLPGNAGNDLESLGYTRAEILRRVHVLNPAGSFRAVYGYSNFGITEGAVAAAKAAGLGWEKAAQDIIFRPLGMSATSARYADFLAQPDRAVLHVPGGARWIARLTRDPDAQSPGGGISSSARDMARWVRMELNEGSLDGKQIVATAALRETHKPIILTGLNPADQRPSFYGLGWAVSFGPHGPVWEHAGAFTNGARTIVRLLPDQHLGIVVLTNAFPTGIPEALTDSFIDTLFDGHPSRDWTAFWNRFFATLIGPGPGAAADPYATPPASASPALPLSAYAGTYANDYLGTRELPPRWTGLFCISALTGMSAGSSGISTATPSCSTIRNTAELCLSCSPSVPGRSPARYFYRRSTTWAKARCPVWGADARPPSRRVASRRA